jgi:signal-transduction protein with cAMP-binding, CBS, and nucleotidyltransferase domain
LFYSGDLQIYEVDEPIFKFGQTCDFIYIVMMGVVEVDLTDGRQEYMLDILGRGSVIGLQSMLNEDL